MASLDELLKKKQKKENKYLKTLEYNLSDAEDDEQDYTKLFEPNSKAQYNHEKSVGGAFTDLSYDEWKKL